MQLANFIDFLGHVHSAPHHSPLDTHLLLYHPNAESSCGELGEHDLQSVSAHKVLSDVTLARGAHVNIVSCSGGVSHARVADDVLGLVPAFFCAGASSVLAALWDIGKDPARSWALSFAKSWMNSVQTQMSNSSDDVPQTLTVDVGECVQKAARNLCEQKGVSNVDAWAPYVHYGYWDFPVVPSNA